MAATRDQAARAIRPDAESAEGDASGHASSGLEQLRHVAEEAKRHAPDAPNATPGEQPAAAVATATPAAPKSGRRKFVALGIIGLLALAAASYAVHYVLVGRFYISTDDAYVRGNNTMLGARVAGHITANGAEITGPDPSRILMFQDATLYPWRTVWDNAALGLEARGLLKARRGKVDDALNLVGLGTFAKAYPRQLSGGMAQRVALARALVNDPSLLLLDEPLAKLDSLTRIAMQAELIRLWQETGFTGILVTHDVEEALFLAERVIVFSDRPACVKSEVVVDRPYPRHRGDPYLAELRRRILEDLGLAETW